VRTARREALHRFILGPHFPGGLTSGTAVARKNGLHLLQRLARIYREVSEDHPRGLRVRRARAAPSAAADAGSSSAASASAYETVSAAPPGVVLIDPAYEGAHEFASVLASLRATLTQWPSACVAVWYPVLRDGALLKSERARAAAAAGARRADAKTAAAEAARQAEASGAQSWFRRFSPVGNAGAADGDKTVEAVDGKEDDFSDIRSFVSEAEVAMRVREAQAASSAPRSPANEREYESLLIRAFDTLPRHRHRSLFLDLARRVALSQGVQRLLRSDANAQGLGDRARRGTGGDGSTDSDDGWLDAIGQPMRFRFDPATGGAVREPRQPEPRQQRRGGRFAAAQAQGEAPVSAEAAVALAATRDTLEAGAVAGAETTVVAEVFTNSTGFTIGSGMLIVNPPSAAELKPQLRELVPWLATALNADALGSGEALRRAAYAGERTDADRPVADYTLEWA
jgi:hypothetical protein